MAHRFQSIAIIGTGLIGSSLGLALQALKEPPRIVGFDLSGDSRRTAMSMKAVDRVTGDLTEAVREADLIVVATPVRTIAPLLQEIGLLAKDDAVVTDTGSTKEQVLAWAEEYLPTRLQFVGGHPMAGKGTAGPADADGGIFQNATYCICPLPRTDRGAVEAFVKLVEALGAVPYFVDPPEHDGLVAAISHLPYLLSVATVNAVTSDRSWREAATLAAGGFATASHLSESDPRMFTDIVLTNRTSVLRQIDRVVEQLEALRDQIDRGDDGVKTLFQEAQTRHREWLSGRAAESTRPPRTGVSAEAMTPYNSLLGSRLTNSLGGLLKGKREPEK
ncbi:MAG: prephenate dehydrogenase/arogenate dehydrogenase family protein [Chloroflexi bacterium]|nr:prephenate dehydrogenase/arogenate dehydrogenase family protein [Chloroflexota bacterium]